MDFPENEEDLIKAIEIEREEISHFLSDLQLNLNLSSIPINGRCTVQNESIRNLFNIVSEDTSNLSHSTTLNSLAEEAKALQDLLEVQALKFKNFIEEMQSFENSIKYLEEETTNLNEAPKLKLDRTLEHMKKRLFMEKKKLKEVISSIFPEDLETRDLLGGVVNHYFTAGPGKYYSLDNEDGVAERVSVLKRSFLFETHADDLLKIRLVDLT